MLQACRPIIISYLDLENMFQILKIADTLGDDALCTACYRFIGQNAPAGLSEMPEWQALSGEAKSRISEQRRT